MATHRRRLTGRATARATRMPTRRGTHRGITAHTTPGTTHGTGIPGITILGITHHGTMDGTIRGITVATGDGGHTITMDGAAIMAAIMVVGIITVEYMCTMEARVVAVGTILWLMAVATDAIVAMWPARGVARASTAAAVWLAHDAARDSTAQAQVLL